MTEVERETAINLIAANPEGGDIVRGLGGARKVRVPREGGGKSGGYRVITYYLDAGVPVFLLWVISKGRAANLTDKQMQFVKDAAKTAKADRRVK